MSRLPSRRSFLKGAAASTGVLGLAQFGSGSARADPIVIGETGSVSVSQRHADEWHSVSLGGFTGISPVVIMQPVSYHGIQPAHIRLRNVTSDSFEFRIEEWRYQDGGHVREDLHYIALEPGLHELAGLALNVEVGSFHVAEEGTAPLSYGFDDPPVVLTQSQTYNGKADPIVSRTEAGTNAVGARIQEEEARNHTFHRMEEVGYMAFQQGTNPVNILFPTFEVQRTDDPVDHTWSTIEFEQEYASENMVFLADMQTIRGPNTANLRYDNLDAESVDLFVEEEQSQDNETWHAPEDVGYLVFDEPGPIYA